MSDAVPATPSPPKSTDEIDLFELAEKIWSERYWVLKFAGAFALIGALNAFRTTPVFESRAVLVPVNTDTRASGAGSLISQLGPMAGLAGLAPPVAVSSATLESDQFAEDFIVRHNLMPVLYADAWDSTRGRWMSDDPEEQPDIRDAVRLFKDSILKVNEDPEKLGLITVTVTWEDPALAQAWASKLVTFANETLRNRALERAERNVEHLKSEAPLSNSVAVQQSIGRLLDQELQTVMLAKGNPEYAFTVIDPPKVPKYKSSPKRAQMIVLSTLAGVLVGLLALLFRSAIRARRARSEA